MPWLLSVLVTMGLAGALPLASSAPAHACSCVYAPDGPQIVEQVSAAASVFTGTATAKRVDGNTGLYEFDVREVFSGDVGATTVVSSYGLSASCGRGFEIGTEYIVFASAPENPAASWSVNSCSATTESSNERTHSAAVAVYGLPRTPDPQRSVGIDDADTSLRWVIAATGGTIVFVMVLLGWRMRVRGRDTSVSDSDQPR
ncbi:MAG: hypothetical protein U5O16_37165 [Rhodococcus sp. (in: high G+C Gram-positive bacteria)]|uniref:hypothetical protein n=1 Tax=Rhodococcus sp. TaxID=1831 RepID=UPI002ADC4BF3|nr:hypothetical protein [Rhodococcus sp. (in: high G+C Gram-positive bacteria)]